MTEIYLVLVVKHKGKCRLASTAFGRADNFGVCEQGINVVLKWFDVSQALVMWWAVVNAVLTAATYTMYQSNTNYNVTI